jgi:hypothetical protein
MIKIFMYFIFLFVNAHALVENNFCKLQSELLCTGHYNWFKYSEVCEAKAECNGKYHVKCNTNYCSSSKEMCHKHFKRFNFFGFIQTLFINKERLVRVEDCPSSSFENSLRLRDVCQNNMLKLMTIKNHKTFLKKYKCPNSHSFECGQAFCTTNNKVCSALRLSNTTAISLTRCFNGEKNFYDLAKHFSNLRLF